MPNEMDDVCVLFSTNTKLGIYTECPEQFQQVHSLRGTLFRQGVGVAKFRPVTEMAGSGCERRDRRSRVVSF